MQTFGLKALANPTVKDMEGYLRYGQIAAWPYLGVLHDMIRLEHALDKALARLEERWRNLTPDMDWSYRDGDDVESIASSSHPLSSIRRIQFSTSVREAECLKQKVISLERENQTLKQELERMKGMLRQHGFSIEEPESGEEKKEVAADGESSTLSLDEKDVWKLVTKHRK